MGISGCNHQGSFIAGMGRQGRRRVIKIVPKCQVLLTRNVVVPLGRRKDYEKKCVCLVYWVLGGKARLDFNHTFGSNPQRRLYSHMRGRDITPAPVPPEEEENLKMFIFKEVKERKGSKIK